ncbi:ATP-binding protein [Paracraurococcus lichenis]|uniref:AAA family ATPase n=1 Tax=Paracraurococcus lichenis TaxID=3064888 RepID=A0ABT9DTI1_9PROT|nr:AAA family ATPase [Paracraurococcus sp. LOR1-02]MDO9707202.1 AAA family ATPase [Paracraurococcus sp. LOR1-02]
MTEIAAWLRSLGLDHYVEAFGRNNIDPGLLPSLTAEDLKEIGVASVGHRRRLLDAIAALRGPSAPLPAAPPDPLADPPAEAAAERRRVTVLFCDLADSTALAARLDPEDLRAAMAGYHRTVSAVIEAHGGYIAKFLGDGVLAYFGWPRAGEDDAERAVRAGLAATAAVAGLDLPTAGPLVARVGIATGEVVVGDLLGEGEARERAMVGATPNLAARLQAMAAPGTVLACPVTRRLTGTLFDWEALGPQALKGLGEAVLPSRALAESSVESRFEALRRGLAVPLVGREEELELLLRRWRRARAGEGQVVLLRGEAGIGKSRLAATLREALAESGEPHRALTFSCQPQARDSALQPVILRMERAAGLLPEDPPEARLAKLEAILLPLAPPPEHVAAIAELLSVPTLGRWPAPDPAPQKRREVLLAALATRIRALAARRPLLVLVEDAHWIDPTTRELLDLLVTEGMAIACLLVVTHRPEFEASAWLGHPHVTPLQVNRLTVAEHALLLRRLTRGKPLPAELEAEILARSDGVPLFVEELGRAVLEGELLREEEDRWVLEGPLPPLAVPASLQASLMARLDRAPALREVALAASVLGREFTYPVVAEVAALPPARLEEGLAQLEASGLLHRIGTPPAARYAFRHALLQDAAYGTLLRERRRLLHHRAAEAIARLRPELAERAPEVLARHRAAAGDAREAIALYRRAGERSAARLALREARAQLTAALELLEGLPCDAARDRLELELRTTLAVALTWLEGQAASAGGEAYARACDLACRLGETARLVPLLGGLAVHHINRAAPELAGRLAEEMLQRARAAGDAAGELSAERVLGYALFKQGRLAAAETHLRRVLDRFEAGRHRAVGAGFPMDTRIGALVWQANTLLLLGRPEQGAACSRTALAEAEALQNVQAQVTALTSAGCAFHCFARDPEAVLRHAAALEGLNQRAPAFRDVARIYRGWALAAHPEGDPAEGIARMEEALADYRASGAGTVVLHALGLVADACRRTGRVSRGLDRVAEALALAEAGGDRVQEAELHRIRGELLRLRPGGEAEASFRRALGVARAQQALLWELRAAVSLARLWRDRGRMAAARGLLGPVWRRFTEGFGFADLVEVQALMEELGPGPEEPEGRPPCDPDYAAGPVPAR